MKIAILGATGYVGKHLVDEALSRGHSVLAIMRDKGKLKKAHNLEAREIDVNDTKALADALVGYDVVIHAFTSPRSLSVEERIAIQKKGTESIIRAVKEAKVPRLLAVGGAGTSEVAPGVALMDSYFFPPEYEGGAKSTAVIKDQLLREKDLDWVFICPPNFLVEGPRTGKYRTGKDNLIVDLSNGSSHINLPDYAMAFLDEVENPRHSRERFTVGA